MTSAGAENIGRRHCPDHRSPVMLNLDPLAEAVFVYTVTVVDNAGETGYASGQYEVAPYINTPPELYLRYDNRLLVATVFDADGDDVEVSLETTGGITGDTHSVVVLGGEGESEFFLQGGSLFAAARPATVSRRRPARSNDVAIEITATRSTTT
jgi:hypothetical protein